MNLIFHGVISQKWLYLSDKSFLAMSENCLFLIYFLYDGVNEQAQPLMCKSAHLLCLKYTALRWRNANKPKTYKCDNPSKK